MSIIDRFMTIIITSFNHKNCNITIRAYQKKMAIRDYFVII